MKKLISMFITGAMLLTAFPTVSAAMQTNPGYTTEQPAVKTDAVSLPTLDVGDESAFKVKGKTQIALPTKQVRLRLAQALAFP